MTVADSKYCLESRIIKAMAENIVIYHGSNVEVPSPQIFRNGFTKDFGYGFYCTRNEKQAKRWALSRKGASILNKYEYVQDKSLKILVFEEMSDEWLDFVVASRTGHDHPYDIVEGPMADDRIWNYVEGFMDGTITREAFWALVKFDYPTHQIVFCSESSLNTLKYLGSETL